MTLTFLYNNTFLFIRQQQSNFLPSIFQTQIHAELRPMTIKLRRLTQRYGTPHFNNQSSKKCLDNKKKKRLLS